MKRSQQKVMFLAVKGVMLHFRFKSYSKTSSTQYERVQITSSHKSALNYIDA